MLLLLFAFITNACVPCRLNIFTQLLLTIQDGIPVLQFQKALRYFKSRDKTGVSVMFMRQREHITLLDVSVCKALSGRFSLTVISTNNWFIIT